MVSFLPLPASGGSRRPSLGWWPPPSRLCLHLHVASALCPRLSCVLIKDPVSGFKATFIQKTSFQNPFFHSICKNLFLQNKVTLKSSGLRTWTYFVGVTTETIGRKAMTNLDSVFKSRDVTLPTKVCLVKAVVFPVVMYGCESWTIMKAESRLTDAFELQCWRRLLRVPWTARRSNHSIPKDISPEFSLEGLILKLKLQFFGHLMQRADLLKRPCCWERLKARGEGDDRGWDGWMASRTGWTWVWASSGRWWWTGRPGVLPSKGHTRPSNWTERNWLKPLQFPYWVFAWQKVNRGFCVFLKVEEEAIINCHSWQTTWYFSQIKIS